MYQANEIVKIAGVENYIEDWEALYNIGKRYIVKWKTIHCLHYSQNAGYYATKVYTSDGNMTQRGRHFMMTAESVNNLIGREHFIAA